MTAARWVATRLKYVTDCNVAVLPESTDPEFEFTYVDISDVTQGSMTVELEPVRFAAAPSRARRVAREGDTVISTVRTYLRAVATVPAVDHELIFSTGFAVLSPRSLVERRFLAWYLQGDEFVARVESHSTGVSYPAITAAALTDLALLLPPLDEQRAIADYLDRETAQIDTLIEEQQRLIDLLHERRTAVITRAATRGIDDAPVVDSGNLYLGTVPAHWVVSRFSRETNVNGGQVDPRDDPWSDMVLVAPNHIESGTGRILGRETARDQAADSGKYIASAGQILYSKIRPALNKVAVASEDCLTSADMYALSSRHGDDHRYLMYFMLAQPFRSFATLTSLRVKMPKINREELGEAPFVRPPLEEQRRIVAFLDEQTAKIDQLIAETERFIELSRERRSALITAAVTGQIDVRAEVA